MLKKAKDDKLIKDTKTTKKAATPKAKSKTNTKKANVKKSEAKTTTRKKTATAKLKTAIKKVTAKTTPKKKVSTKTAITKSKTNTKKSNSNKKTANKKASTKQQEKISPVTKKSAKSTTKTTVKKTSTKTKKVNSKKSSLKNKKAEIIEYYDLPYKYNKTVIKLLAQTPTTLFVYWEVSNKDKEEFIKNYGEFFFNNTKPVLKIYNRTLNYSFEIDINDFANSWYIRVNDANCDYDIELGRRGINEYIDIADNYLYISNSNEIESPNDHILFEKLPDKILFKNVKTNYTMEKALFYYLAKIKSNYNVKDFYKNMYKDEDFDFDKLTLKNPSSSSPSY